MPIDVPSIPGSKWWKFDFHTHTPGSLDYKENITPVEWILSYMRNEVDCVAVTDHNSTGWLPLLVDALESLEKENHPEFRPLVIFPGFELTVSGGFHVLGIFDPSKSHEEVSRVIGACDYRGTPGDSDTVTNCSVQDVIEKIVAHKGIAIPAHVDDVKGLWGEDDHMTLTRVLKLDCLYAVEKMDMDNANPQLVTDLHKELSYVVGSDSHKLADNGAKFCWVKMAKPDKEGLRLALLDASLSILRYDSDQLNGNPNHAHSEKYIEAVEIVDAQYIGRGRPFVQNLNPWMNSVIGGRGTGKSSFLEFVRIGCCRDSELDVDGYEKLREEFSKYKTICTARGRGGLCTNDTVFKVFYRNIGELFRIEFDRSEKAYTVYERDRNGDWQLLDEQDVTSRFPIKVYSQKQVYQIAEDPQALLYIVDESSHVSKYLWEDDWRSATSTLSMLLEQISVLSAALGGEKRLRGTLVDVGRKLELFENDENTEVLKAYQLSKKQLLEVRRWVQGFDGVPLTLAKVHDDLSVPPFVGESFSAESDQEFIELAASFDLKFTSLKTELVGLHEAAEKLLSELKVAVEESEWKKLQDAVANQYAELVKLLEEQGVENPDGYNELVEQKNRTEEQLKGLESTKAELSDLYARQAAQMEAVQNLRDALTRRRREFLNETVGANEHVRISITQFGDLDDAISSLRGVLRLDDGIFEKQVYDTDGGSGLLNIIYDDGGQPRDDFRNQLREMRVKVKKICAGDEDIVANLDKRFVSRLQKMTQSDLVALDHWYPEDALEVSYKSEARRQWESISQGSPGQKTAAILAFLLSYGDEPLLLDQPEDDLDNQLIFSLIVKQLIANKARRQLIVVTHNPNIVVNGDSELVLALESSRGQTRAKSVGGLQEADVRADICMIMEGGEKAFEKRYRRIIQA